MSASARAAATGAPGADELARELEIALGLARGRLEVLERHPIAYRSSFPIEALRVRVAGDGARWLVRKDLGLGGPAAAGWRHKPAFLHDPRREIETYRDALAGSGLSAPVYLGSLVDPPRGRYVLLLERIEGEPLWQRGEVATWQRAARWLAGLHARFAGRAAELPRRLVVHDARHHERWLERARRFLAGSAAPAELASLARRAGAAAGWLAAQHPTLLHGEPYPSNVLVEGMGVAERIRPVDWEMAGLGPGVLDLAALASGGWGEPERAAIAEAYREALPWPLRPSAEALQEGLRHCRVLLAVQWLGWAPGWRPPREHAQDWLASALELPARAHGEQERASARQRTRERRGGAP